MIYKDKSKSCGCSTQCWLACVSWHLMEPPQGWRIDVESMLGWPLECHRITRWNSHRCVHLLEQPLITSLEISTTNDDEATLYLPIKIVYGWWIYLHHQNIHRWRKVVLEFLVIIIDCSVRKVNNVIDPKPELNSLPPVIIIWGVLMLNLILALPASIKTNPLHPPHQKPVAPDYEMTLTQLNWKIIGMCLLFM